MKCTLASLAQRIGNLGGLSRQGVIVTSRWVRTHPLPSGSRRVLWLLPASVMIGAGVASLAAAGLGVAPYDVGISAIAHHTLLSFGQSSWAMSGTLFLLAAMLGVRPTSRSLGLIFLNGLTIDIALQIVSEPQGLGARIGLAAFGAAILVVGVATVVYQAAAGGAFEALMQAAEKHGRSPVVVRSALEVGSLVLGAIAGGSIGVMTVIIALTIGPAIGLGLQAFDDHRLGRDERLAAAQPECQSVS
jgi:uncharacterized membrane protein YczE